MVIMFIKRTGSLILEISCIAKENLYCMYSCQMTHPWIPMLISPLCSLYIMRNILEAESIKVKTDIMALSLLAERLVIHNQYAILHEP